MANQPRPDNPARQVRVDDELWHAAHKKARTEGTTVSAVIRSALRQFLLDRQHHAGVTEG